MTKDEKGIRIKVGLLELARQLGRLIFGPRFSAKFRQKSGTVTYPYIGIKGIWDFATSDIVELATGVASEDNDNFRARIDGGVNVSFYNSLQFQVKSFYDGIGARKYQSYGGSLNFSIPLQND